MEMKQGDKNRKGFQWQFHFTSLMVRSSLNGNNLGDGSISCMFETRERLIPAAVEELTPQHESRLSWRFLWQKSGSFTKSDKEQWKIRN